MIYDKNAEYKRCGHKMQQAFGITAEQFQAARKTGRKKRFGDILDWIKNNRETLQAGLGAAPAQSVHAKSNSATSIPGLMPRGTIVLVPVPTEKLHDVLTILGQ